MSAGFRGGAARPPSEYAPNCTTGNKNINRWLISFVYCTVISLYRPTTDFDVSYKSTLTMLMIILPIYKNIIIITNNDKNLEKMLQNFLILIVNYHLERSTWPFWLP